MIEFCSITERYYVWTEGLRLGRCLLVTPSRAMAEAELAAYRR